MGPGLIPRPVVSAIAAVIVAVWALSQAAVIFVPGYEAPPEIHLSVMLILGALFGMRKDGNGNGGEPAKPPPPPPAPAPAQLEGEPAPLPPGAVSAADLIARLQAERRDR